MKRVSNITDKNISSVVSETIGRIVNEGTHAGRCSLKEDMTRSQVESAIEDYVKTKDFEKRVNNIVVDTVGEFIENMWTKKSFWKTMLKKR